MNRITIYKPAEVALEVVDVESESHPPPTPPTSGLLTSALAALAPGEIALATNMVPEGGFTIRPASGGGYSIIDWTPRNVWSTKHMALIHAGKRKGKRLVRFNEPDGPWFDPPTPPEWLMLEYESTGHAYGKCAYDGEDHVFALETVFNIADATFEPIPPTPGGGLMAYTCPAPRILAGHGLDPGFVVYSFDAKTWQSEKTVKYLGHGLHAHLEYHPLLDACLLIGGNPAALRDPATGLRLRDANGALIYGTSRRAHVIDMQAGGKPQPRLITECPQTLVMSKGAFVVRHPTQRCWIVRGDDATGSPARLWACWPDRVGNEWQDLGLAPLRAPVALCAEHDGLFSTRNEGVYAYRLPTL
jgi:hypothetical protein